MIALRRFRKIPTQHPGKLFLASLGGAWTVLSLQQWDLPVDQESKRLLAGEMVNMEAYTLQLQAQIDVFEGGWRRELREGFCRGSDWYAAKRSLALVYEMENPPPVVKSAKKAIDGWSWVERLEREVGLSSPSKLSKDYMELVNGKVDAEFFHRALSMQIKASGVDENQVAARVGTILQKVQLVGAENWAPVENGDLIAEFGGCRLYRRVSGDVVVPWTDPSALSRFVARLPTRFVPIMDTRWDGMFARVLTTDSLPQQPRTDVDWVGLFRPLVQKELWPCEVPLNSTLSGVLLSEVIRIDRHSDTPYWCDAFRSTPPNISAIRALLNQISTGHVDTWMQAITGSSSSSSSSTKPTKKSDCFHQ